MIKNLLPKDEENVDSEEKEIVDDPNDMSIPIDPDTLLR